MGGGTPEQHATAAATRTGSDSDRSGGDGKTKQHCFQRCKQKLESALAFLKTKGTEQMKNLEKWTEKTKDWEKPCPSLLAFAIPPLLLFTPQSCIIFRMVILGVFITTLAGTITTLAGAIAENAQVCIIEAENTRKQGSKRGAAETPREKCPSDDADPTGADEIPKEKCPSDDADPNAAQKRRCKSRKKCKIVAVVFVSIVAVCALSRGFGPAPVPFQENSVVDTAAAHTDYDLNVAYNNQVELAHRHAHLANNQEKLVSRHARLANHQEKLARQQQAAVERLVLMTDQVSKLTDRLRLAEVRLNEKDKAIAEQNAVIKQLVLMGEQLKDRLGRAERRRSGTDESTPTAAKDLDVIGQRVEVSGRFPGAIEDVKSSANGKVHYLVRFDDGNHRAWIERRKIRLAGEPGKAAARKPPTYKVGQRVTALWEPTGKYYRGVVSEIRGADSYFIDFDDGDTAVVKESQIQPVESFKFSAGERVLAQWPANKLYYSGVVEACHSEPGASKARCDVKFDDGDRAEVPMGGIRRLDQRKLEAPVSKFTVGDKVRALWRVNGKFYPAVISIADDVGSTYSVTFKHRKRNKGGMSHFLHANEVKPIFHLKAARNQ
mmetsp:Transcript_18197/g.34721  ORF Transcript_18197/g.34721 Transcript_18197/m.34721 type:complete len:606 (-) Transcript_18197:109-1926(-)